jgi:hypothetical protein
MLCLAALAAATFAIPTVASAKEPDGAPTKATVKFRSLMGIPAAGYSLVCPPGIPSCTTSGNIDLETEAEVPVTYEKNLDATYGTAPLSYSKSEGTASMSFTCEGKPDPYVSKLSVSGTAAGELEIASVKAVHGTNLLAVALNHGGDTGEKLPAETYDRSDGGCGAPVNETSPLMSTWYYNFYEAHRESQQPTTNDLELQGLFYNNGAYTKSYDRMVNVSNGGTTYPLYEHTIIEVEPEFCTGSENKISAATADGSSLGLDGASFYPGQVITAPAKTQLSLGDGSKLLMEKGGEFEVEKCADDQTSLTITNTVRKMWNYVKHALAGSHRKFEVSTPRAVAGVRGTKFALSYDAKKELTKVWGIEHIVTLKGRNGAKGMVKVGPGQIAVQKGKGAPHLVKR